MDSAPKTQPQHIGRYQIKAELGRGGMATVFHAYDPRFERDVAVKILPKALLHDPQFRARFEREAKTIGTLEHPAIVPVYDFGEEDGQPYIVMRLMAGGSLAERMQQGKFSLDEVVRIIARLAPALDAAHARGIIHRDLKPGNILFDQYNNAFLSDFGIARMTGASVNLTGSAIIGTPAYMSPEQIQGEKEIDGRSDIYALGVILYQMLTGQMPYNADTPAKVMMMHILEPVPHISQIDPALPPGCDQVIGKAMAKNPDDRYASSDDLSTHLSGAVQQRDATRVEEPVRPPAEATVVSPSTPLPPIGAAVGTDAGATHVTPDPTPAPAAAAGRGGAAPAIPARRGLSFSSPMVLFILLGLVVVVGGGLALLGSQGSGPLAFLAAAPTTSPASPTLAPSDTPAPPPPTSPPTEEAVAVLPAATATTPPTAAPSDTPPPTSTPTITASPTPAAPIVGGADKIAFLHQNDIWAANLDGTDLVRLTVDGGEKSNLHWTPDGRWIVYMLGNCAKYVELDTGLEDNIACFESALTFESFQVSPDGTQVAISLNRELFVVPFDLELLSEARFASHLSGMATCEALAPYSRNAVKYVRWSRDSSRLSFVFLGNVQGLLKDLVRIIDIRNCGQVPPTLDEFPVGRFDMRGYETNPEIQNFGWDGDVLYGMNGAVRNGGYGDLYIYNHNTHKGELINPINGKCCYRDISWSPDARVITFVFQDIGLGSDSKEEIYIIPFGTLGTGIEYAPLALPEDFLTNPRERPQPILRPAS